MALLRETVDAPGAPAAVGAYSHAVRAGDLLFCSGQVALDRTTGELVGETAGDQARKCLENLQAVCEAAGTSLDRAVRCGLFLADLPGAWAEVNDVYASFFTADPPARAAVGVSALPKGALVEVDAIVAL
jgi:2-iminobutanoate/2-iminopropanoate deaminase